MADLDSICLIEGCERPARHRGWCNMHYLRWRNHGDPKICNRRPTFDLETVRQKIIDYSEPVTESGCWFWLRFANKEGYGRTSYRGKEDFAHRVSYKVFRGEIPSGLFVLHKCDVPCCVNPDHLFLGTPADNTRDMLKKGRNNPTRGERGSSSKLTASDVIAIRNDNRTNREIGADYGICPPSVSDIKLRKTWAHIPTQENST